MATPHTPLNDRQCQAIRWLAAHRNDGNGYLAREHVIAATELTDGEYVSLLEYLQSRGRIAEIVRIDGGRFAEHFMLSDTIDAEVLKLDISPVRDYPSDVKRWFFSKWWSVPVWLIFVGLPAIVGYITMLRSVVEWINQKG